MSEPPQSVSATACRRLPINSSRPIAAANRCTDSERSRTTNDFPSSRSKSFWTVAYRDVPPSGINGLANLPDRHRPAVPNNPQNRQLGVRNILSKTSHHKSST